MLALTSLKKALFPDEFIIDELRLPIYTRESVAAVAVMAGSDDPEGLGLGEGKSPEAKGIDLLSQMSELLLDQVRLAERARQLEKNRSGDDEFGRFVRQAIPFLDNFHHLLDLAREYPPSSEIDSWLKSVEALYFRIVNLLESYGLRFINSMGKVVDLNVHEVIDYRLTTQYPHNTIMKEMQKGVVFRDRLLRDAKVVVACNEGQP